MEQRLGKMLGIKKGKLAEMRASFSAYTKSVILIEGNKTKGEYEYGND